MGQPSSIIWTDLYLIVFEPKQRGRHLSLSDWKPMPILISLHPGRNSSRLRLMMLTILVKAYNVTENY